MATDPQSDVRFFSRVSIEQVEEGHELAPKFDEHGLIPCVTTAARTGEVLMLGYMNAEALRRTIATGEAHYWSRSRKVLWHKGATSGLTQKVVELRVDDDQHPHVRPELAAPAGEQRQQDGYAEPEQRARCQASGHNFNPKRGPTWTIAR